MPQEGSRIFVGFRALGFHCNHVPLALQYHKKHRENYVITAVGKAFQTYNCSRLGITSISDVHPDNINYLVSDAAYVFTACQNIIRAFQRNKTVKFTYEGHEKDVHLLLPFGQHLVSVDDANILKIWKIHTQELYLEVTFNKITFEISSIIHPSTYLNKILLGSSQGTMQLWNIKTNKLVYSFDSFHSRIHTLEQAPAVDVIGIGLESGKVIIHNIKYDESIMTFTQEWGPVTTIAFRTDGHPVMATGSTAGHVALWDLEERKLLSQMRDVHHGAVASLKYLPSEPLMVSTSADNSIKIWIFDIADGGGRLLRQRSGHYAPPSKIRFYGPNGTDILSAGQDSTLKSFSTEHDKHNKNLGQASMNRKLAKRKGIKYDEYKLPPITVFASETSRQSEWDGIIACHLGSPVVTSWNYQKCSMGKHKIQHERFTEEKHIEALCTDISSCGNFFIVGWNKGHVDLYNIQSGIHRGQYGQTVAHSGAVRGVAIDGLNQIVVTASTDKTLKFWRFKKKNLLFTLKTDLSISQILLHRESSMLAVANDDFSLIIVDIDVRRIVRKFIGHKNRITDMCFSPDGRWLLTTSMDSAVRTWHLPSGRLIDVFLVDPPPTSVTMSPTADFIATSHVDDLGVYLWSNRTLFSHVSLHPLPEDYIPTQLLLPGTHHGEDHHDDISDSTVSVNVDEEFKSPQQISAELITLSLLPHSRWKNLTNLELIKKRNKPKEPPKVAKSAPFFLPTIPGLTPQFKQPDVDAEKKVMSHVIDFAGLQAESEFIQLIKENIEMNNFESILGKLKELSPSSIDIEIRSLSPIGGGSIEHMLQFLQFLQHMLESNQDFELAQAYIAIFLKLHGDIISSEPSLLDSVQKLSSVHQSSWQRIHQQFNQSLCLLNYLRNVTL